jgi:hypothetical protein
MIWPLSYESSGRSIGAVGPWMIFLGQRFEDVPVMAHTASFGTFTSGLLGMDIL